MTTTPVNEWRVPRESIEWVGPIEATVINRSTEEPVALHLKIAVLPKGVRPTDDDWIDPTGDPDGTAGPGYLTSAVTGYMHEGIWARDVDDPEKPVLEPDQVGWIIRT